MVQDEQQQQVDKNFEAFKQMLPNLPKSKWGKFALMHDTEIIEYFDTMADALKAGNLHYADGLFSIQKVDDEVIDLGFYSHAVPYATIQQ